jgi:hypothetical protein
VINIYHWRDNETIVRAWLVGVGVARHLSPQSSSLQVTTDGATFFVIRWACNLLCCIEEILPQTHAHPVSMITVQGIYLSFGLQLKNWVKIRR